MSEPFYIDAFGYLVVTDLAWLPRHPIVPPSMVFAFVRQDQPYRYCPRADGNWIWVQPTVDGETVAPYAPDRMMENFDKHNGDLLTAEEVGVSAALAST